MSKTLNGGRVTRAQKCTNQISKLPNKKGVFTRFLRYANHDNMVVFEDDLFLV